MTIKEIKYADYVSSFIGIPYRWNSWDRGIGLDCRTLTVRFLKGIGYDIDGSDGLDIPSDEELAEIKKDASRMSELRERYTLGVKETGEVIEVGSIKPNDIVMYETMELPHIGVYIGGGKLLVAAEKHKSMLIRLSSVKGAIITIVRVGRR